MPKERVFTAIDLGTTKVCTLVVRVSSKGYADIIGVGFEPSHGLKKGIVVNVEETRRAVRESVRRAEQRAGSRVRSAYIGVTGSHIESNNTWIPVVSMDENAVITRDQLKLLSSSIAIPDLEPDREVIHTIPRGYALDGRPGIRNPVGMHVRQLEMHTQTVTGSSPLINTLADSVTSLGVEVKGLVLQPLASGEAVLSDEEKEMGVVLVDIGGGTSDIAVFQDGALVHTSVIPLGGFQFTNDISMIFDTSLEEAERVKLQYGNVNPELVDVNEEVELTIVGQDKMARIPRREICQIIKERAVELLQLVRAKLGEASLEGMPEARVVLTGGSANIPGLENLARRILTASVRIGVPSKPEGIPEELKNPSYSTSVGILLWCMNEYPLMVKSSNGFRSASGLYSRLLSWFLGRVRSVVAA